MLHSTGSLPSLQLLNGIKRTKHPLNKTFPLASHVDNCSHCHGEVLCWQLVRGYTKSREVPGSALVAQVIQGKHQRETGMLSQGAAPSPPPSTYPSSSVPISPQNANPMGHLSAAFPIGTSLPLASFLLLHFRKAHN